MRVLAVDPGLRQSAFCLIDADTLRPVLFGIEPNEDLRHRIRQMDFSEEDRAAVEMMQSYGNLIGRDVLETAVWIGRFYEALLRRLAEPPALVFRMEERMHICRSARAGDAEIRRALIDRFCDHDFRMGRGTKAEPDWFHGFRADVWAAYAVGLTFIETKMEVLNG